MLTCFLSREVVKIIFFPLKSVIGDYGECTALEFTHDKNNTPFREPNQKPLDSEASVLTTQPKSLEQPIILFTTKKFKLSFFILFLLRHTPAGFR